MRLPRDVSGPDLVRALKTLGYQVTRQTGSHLRLTTHDRGEHHITIPLRVGTLAAILTNVAEHFDMSGDDLASRLFRPTSPSEFLVWSVTLEQRVSGGGNAGSL
jgi:predicted RNA binding protein YcfA (HicA-like mRNA interferase family)